MNTSLKLLSMAVLCILAACKPEEEPKPTPQPEESAYVTLDSSQSTSKTIAANGDEFAVNFKTNKSWKAEVTYGSASGWINLSSNSGNSGSAALIVTVKPNNDKSKRTAIIAITAGDASSNITVSQDGISTTISVSSSELNFKAEGGDGSITVTSNSAWKAEVSGGSDWVNLTPGNGSAGSSAIKVTAKPNTDKSKRTATVTVTADDAKASFTVSQDAFEPVFSISPTSFDVDSEGGQIEVKVTSNQGYSIKSNADWIHHIDTKAAETKTLVFTVDSNTSVKARSGVIVLCNDEQVCIPVTVNQKAAEAKISVTPSQIELASDGDIKTVTVSSNTSWTADVSYVTGTSGWITLSSSSGTSGDTPLIITIDANSLKAKRSATINFTAGTASSRITLIQGAFVPIFEIETKSFDVPQAGGLIEVKLKSNLDFSVTPSENWIQPLRTKSASENSRFFSIEANPTFESRSGVIVFCNTENVCIPVTVKQSGMNVTLSVSASEMSFSSASGEKSLGIKSNTNWKITSDSQWLSVNTNSGEGDGKVQVKVTENGNVYSRSGKIKVTAGDDSTVAEVTVNQEAGEPFLNISENSISFDGNGGKRSFSITSNADWIIESNNSWIKAEPATGTGNTLVTLNCEINSKPEKRLTEVTVKTSDGSIKKTIAISQSEGDAYITLSSYEHIFEVQSGSVLVNVNSNIDWKVTSDSSWCSVVKSDKSFTIKVNENATGKKRTAKVKVEARNGGIEVNFNVAQKAKEGNEGFGDDGNFNWD